MRKILLMICGALAVSGISAQITLTAETSVPRVGDIFRYHVMEAEDWDITFGGENQQWDMSAAGEGITSKVKYISVENSSEPSTQANLVSISEEAGNSLEIYYTASATGLAYNKTIINSMMETAINSYTDAMEVLRFPLTYGQEYDETFAGTITYKNSGITLGIEGNTKIIADGYGKLELPFGTVNNVLRVKLVCNVYMDVEGLVEVDTAYLWYNANTRNIIAQYSLIYVEMGWGMEKYSSVLQYLSQDNIIGLGMKPTYDNSLSIYPNPTQGIINIEGTTPDVKLYNVNGVLLRQEKSSTIDISEFSNGLYLMEIAGKKYKIIKQ